MSSKVKGIYPLHLIFLGMEKLILSFGLATLCQVYCIAEITRPDSVARPASGCPQRTRRGQPVADPNRMRGTYLPVGLRFCHPIVSGESPARPYGAS